MGNSLSNMSKAFKFEMVEIEALTRGPLYVILYLPKIRQSGNC